MPVQPLPIDDLLPQITGHLSSAGTVVVKAEPGAGKTTRIPPAILEANLAQLDGDRPGQIIVLQPRRVAARAAAMRMSDERGTALGADVGYQVRHESRTSSKTRILVCTEGIFLRKLQENPLLENVAVVVFDEFHERSLDSDVALAMTRMVREQVRPDLRIVVMSATLDSEPIARYLGGCPTVESPGRTFPIEIDYLPFPPNAPMERLVADGVKQMLRRTDGHLLVFLPGVGEIRNTQASLSNGAEEDDFILMPLYGELPLEEQQFVLRPSKKRKVILATNIAETSLTIDGVKGVVDSGFARVNRFDPNVGLNRLELSRISKASAAQRAGRAGRTAPGVCLRLWTEREQQMLSDFEAPEIARVDLSECLLSLIAWGEHDVTAFPWFEQPPSASVERALALLDQLDAISEGAITNLGRDMARFPLQPRLSRLLIEGSRLGVGKAAALCAAILSERSPFRRSELPRQSQHHSDSDVLDRVAAIEAFAKSGYRDSIVGELLAGPTKQILKTSSQLYRMLSSPAREPTEDQEDAEFALEERSSKKADMALLQAVTLAFPDRICKRRQPKERRAVMVGGKGVRLADESAVYDGDLFVAVELGQVERSELLVRQASRVERDWLPPSHIKMEVEVEYDSQRERVVAIKRTRFCDLVLEESTAAMPSDADPGALLAQAVATHFDISALVDDEAKAYLARVQCLREWLPELNLPGFSSEPWREFLPEWCCGSTSVADLKAKTVVHAIQARLSSEQIIAVEQDAPERFSLPSGRSVKLQYEPGKPPVLAARIQDLFGITETPRIARSRVSVLVHLLAPNYRVQQITPDLSSFWKNTYPSVKKELKGRYPKHAWPDNPLKPQ